MSKNRIGNLCAALVIILAISSPSTVACAQTFSVLYDFGAKSGDPRQAWFPGIIAQGRDGNLYSTTPWGGVIASGAMFRITPKGTLDVPYSFDYAHENPLSGLTLGTDGNFYGTTWGGGTEQLGTVFKITPSGTVTVLYDFAGPDGANPYAPPVEGADGNFYGTTSQGGTNQSFGTVYKFTSSGKFTTLYSFDGIHGRSPFAPLVRGADGNFYGTTFQEDGVVYEITSSGKFTVLHHFGASEAAYMTSPLIQANDGNFYGTTTGDGGLSAAGMIFKITSAGRVTVLREIRGGSTGPVLIAGLVQASDGKLYGASTSGGTSHQGAIFRISPKKPYAYKVLYSFDGTTGQSPYPTLIQRTDGILYGDTYLGGTGSVSPCSPGTCGVFYKLSVGLKPFVGLVSTSAKAGRPIDILGQGLKGTKSVSFNGTPATFKVVSDTYLTAEVPMGATTGFVTVTTPKGKLRSNKKFRVVR